MSKFYGALTFGAYCYGPGYHIIIENTNEAIKEDEDLLLNSLSSTFLIPMHVIDIRRGKFESMRPLRRAQRKRYAA